MKRQWKADKGVRPGVMVVWKGDSTKIPAGWIHACVEENILPDGKTGYHHIIKVDNITYLEHVYETKKK